MILAIIVFFLALIFLEGDILAALGFALAALVLSAAL